MLCVPSEDLEKIPVSCGNWQLHVIPVKDGLRHRLLERDWAAQNTLYLVAVLSTVVHKTRLDELEVTLRQSPGNVKI